MAIPDELKVLKDEVAATYLQFKTKVDSLVAAQQKDMNESGSTIASPPPPTAGQQPESSKPDESLKVKVKWDEDLKALVWNLLCLEWEMARLDNELQCVLFFIGIFLLRRLLNLICVHQKNV
jgi:hypothetical protein